MGTWGDGPFDSDIVADFLDELTTSPSRGIARALRKLSKAAPAYVDVDVGAPAWAACELVALSFGRGDFTVLSDNVAAVLDRVKPKEELRLLALEVLPRIADRNSSELAQLWAEAGAGSQLVVSKLDGVLAELGARLAAASEGPLAIVRPEAGEVIVLSATEHPSSTVIVLQVVSRGEVAVFEGTCASDEEALACVERRPARRVRAPVARLLPRARMLGKAPLRKDLRGTKRYAQGNGWRDMYTLMTATGGRLELVGYEAARAHDLREEHDAAALRAVALGTKATGRVRSPEEFEAELRRSQASAWEELRAVTDPSPFGDLSQLESLLTWIETCGLDNAIRVLSDEAAGRTGLSSGPAFDRRAYAFAAMVAVFVGGLSKDTWPAALKERLPAPPDETMLVVARDAARVFAENVLSRDSILRMIWECAPDGGDALREWVQRLRDALGG